MEQNNSPNFKYLPQIISVIVPISTVAIGVYLVKKLFSGYTNPDGTKSFSAPSLESLAIDKTALTISVSDAALFANTLYGAMLDFGTDEKTIFDTIDKINTKDDMLLVIKSFGMKKYLWGTRAGFLGQDINLIGWLRSELSQSDLNKIKPKFDKWNIPI